MKQASACKGSALRFADRPDCMILQGLGTAVKQEEAAGVSTPEGVKSEMASEKGESFVCCSVPGTRNKSQLPAV
jgi:hypothetical protein